MPARILVVEDEFLIRLSLTEALVDAGFAVTDAETADVALQLVQSGSFDLLITDIQLPGTMNGTDLARAARTRQPALPIIYMSGRPAEHSPVSPHDLYIGKPYAPEDLCRAAQRLLGTAPPG